jgi:hypothetical protein
MAEKITLELHHEEAKALLNLLDAAMSCFAGYPSGVLHRLRECLAVEDEKRYPSHEADIDKVIKWFETLSYPTQDKRVEQLDETIQDLHGNLASVVNNAGVAEQVKFVFEQCGDKAWEVFGQTWDEWEFKT